MRILDYLLLSLAELVAIASALDPNITASTPLASVTASVFAGLPACAVSQNSSQLKNLLIHPLDILYQEHHSYVDSLRIERHRMHRTSFLAIA